MFPITLEEIRLKSRNDEFILKMKDQITVKVKNRKVNKSNSILICGGVLMYADRNVIPISWRKRMLKEFHVGHPGISRMKSAIRCYIFWPKMDTDIQNFVKSCRGCAQGTNSPPIKYQPWQEMDIPWSRSHLDFTGSLKREYYQVAVDGYTKWPEIRKCRRLTTTVAINFFHEIFVSFGVLDSIMSDNETRFTSSKWMFFCKSLQIQQTTTPPITQVQTDKRNSLLIRWKGL